MSEEVVKYQERTGDLVERVMFKGVPKDQMRVALAICQRYGLDPILKHVVIIGGNAYITRDGLLQVAHDSGVKFSITFDQPTELRNPYKQDSDIYLSGTLHREGYPDFTAGLWFSEYDTERGSWKSHPAAMHQKVVEVYLLRRGFNVSMTPVDEMGTVHDGEIIEAEVVEVSPYATTDERAEYQTEPPHVNGRPWDTNGIRDDFLRKEADYHSEFGARGDEKITPKLRGAAKSKLETVLGSDERQHKFLAAITGKDSTTNLTYAEGRALYDYFSGEPEMVKAEMLAVVAELEEELAAAETAAALEG